MMIVRNVSIRGDVNCHVVQGQMIAAPRGLALIILNLVGAITEKDPMVGGTAAEKVKNEGDSVQDTSIEVIAASQRVIAVTVNIRDVIQEGS